MTASSFYRDDDNYQPAYGRLHGNRGDGWCAWNRSDDNDWLQVDLGEELQLCAVATQGDRNHDDSDEWVTDFKLSYSSDEKKWTIYKDGNGIEVVSLMYFYFSLKRKSDIRELTNRRLSHDGAVGSRSRVVVL